ncbi:unnamed protein product [Chilo suppressalis]|uniref:DUF4378 domain-containing protein n=1 Tax=Chilo suppressalis TaxID=168631 RepID=A0ABN8B813_CHISP|nr:unnamed protein product [Chilo suppressalis]
MNKRREEIITNKILLVKSLLQRCDVAPEDVFTSTSTDLVFDWYTGYPSSFRKGKEKRQPLTYSQLMHYRDHHPLIQNNLSASEFRRILKKIYLIDRNIPKLADFKIHESENTNDLCSNQKKPFNLLSLAGTKKGIIVEDPVRVFRRTLFLKRIAEVRQENWHIIYVNTIKNFINKINKNKPTATGQKSVTEDHLFVAVSMQLGVLEARFYHDDSQTSKWLLNLLSHISEPCVVVMQEERIDTPTLASSKVEMSDWLTENGIPHNPNAHRGELHDLIKLTMAQGKTSRTDEIIRALGHHVLRYPDDVEELNLLCDNFFSIVSKVNLHSNKCNKKCVLDYIKEVKLEVWQEFEKHVMIDSEWFILQEDMLMEKIIDGLCMMATDGAENCLEDQLIDLPDWNRIASKFIL